MKNFNHNLIMDIMVLAKLIDTTHIEYKEETKSFYQSIEVSKGQYAYVVSNLDESLTVVMLQYGILESTREYEFSNFNGTYFQLLEYKRLGKNPKSKSVEVKLDHNKMQKLLSTLLNVHMVNL